MDEQHPLLDGEFPEPPMPDQPLLKYFVIRQEVRLEVNFRDRRIDGETDVIIATFDDKIEEVLLDAADCDIATDKVKVAEIRYVNGEIIEGQARPVSAEYNDPYRKLAKLPKSNWTAEHHDLRRLRARSIFYSRQSDVPAENREFEGCTPVYGSLKVGLKNKADQDRPRLVIRKSTSNLDGTEGSSHKQYKITIPFSRSNPRDGIHFVGVDALDNRFPHMYTRHSLNPGTASCIFPCIDDHGCRCDWRISIKYPRTLGDALHQALVTQQNGSQRSWDLAEEDKLREMSVVCSGFLMEESVDPGDETKKVMIFEPEKKVSVQNLGFAVGPFEHIDLSSESRTEEDELKLGMNALKVHAYSLPHRGDWVRNTAAALTMAADFMTFTFAKYPFGNFKLVFLDDMVEDAVPLHSMAFVSNRLLYPEDVIDHEIEVTRQIVYTLTYQWTGINMIPNTRSDLWLVMGLAHFMTDLFMKKLCGNNEYRFRMKQLSDRLVQLDVDRPCLYELGPKLHLDPREVEFMTIKTSVVLFILDKRLIKASGGHGLTRILQKMATKNVIDSSDKASILDTEKFRVTCEKGAKFRLESFWNQWVYGTGCPTFDVKARFNKKRLCVELTLNQTQLQNVKKPDLTEEDFLRLVKEKRAGVKIEELQPLFTGPMTIRIHEADGTPYEHILEIREDATRSTKFEIPYNTKYKRLKRTRRLKEKHNLGSSMDLAAENADDALLYSLGDVLQSADELRDWELIEWDPETERKMDQESYEWIRVDADFEWACDMKRNLEPYMYVSQLQQDRDVVAQQDAMLYLTHGPLHPIASGFLVRTLVDRRYFHGIRTMAAQALPRQANIKDLPMLGLRQLMRAFREMFCYDNVSNPNQPRPNDFSDKRQYNVRCAIIKAVASVRDSNHRCPLEARRFILDQLLFNNNEENPFSDHHYIALLVESLATSLIPSKKDDWYARQAKQIDEDEKQFLDTALEQIERVLRRDEWTNSYQNIWTIAGLDAKQRLMKAEVIEKNLAEFGQYLLDGTADVVRIKCFEALIDLGAMMDPGFFTFLLYALSTDRSPYVRNRLIHAVSKGVAAIAFGERTVVTKKEPAPEEDADPLLLVQDSAQEIEARQEMFARKQDLEAALRALQKEMDETYRADARIYSTAMRKALDHTGLGRTEVENLLVLAGMLFEESPDWVVTLNLPKGWTVNRSAMQHPKRLVMAFKSFYRVQPKTPLIAQPAIPPAAPLSAIAEPPRPSPLARTGSIKINTKTSSQRTSLPGSADTNTPTPSIPRPPSSIPKTLPPSLPATTSIKRAREDSGSPAPKRPKTEDLWEIPDDKPRKKSRIVTLRTKDPKRLAVVLNKTFTPSPARTSLPGSVPRTPLVDDSKSARKPLPGGSESVRRPLPGGESSTVRKPLPGADGTRKSLPTGSPSSMSPPPPPASSQPAVRVNTSASPAPSSASKPSPGVSTPSSAAPARKIIKIIRKPQPPPSS
ncbi:hypothetical protein NLU13_1132 [Sarocladium strictum]|uniref:Transcription initiation factor TFIID subunit 2 n=1 Tax=Sarocladium strictum TaxID=5046 RepID=A0AA39GRW4_SARSR|nr:hypothetical protein NLU13_1132 [Sarocladium strictum]